MKLHEIFARPLTEINMGGKSLRREAAKLNALVGFEFEMIVPDCFNPDGDDDDDDLVVDYSNNPDVTSIDDIVEFFDSGDAAINSSSSIRQLQDALKEQFGEWVTSDALPYEWGNRDGLRWIKNWVDENYSLKDGETLEEISKKVQSQEGRDPDPSDAFDEFFDEMYQEFMADSDKEREFLADAGYGEMSDIPEQNRMVAWPHYTLTGGIRSASQDIEDIAAEFEKVLPRIVNWGSSYGSVPRLPGQYALEPDSSIDPDDVTSELGLELISPPLPLAEAFSDMEILFAKFDALNIYTNTSTGLHINVSLPDYDFEKLDYVKLVLLLGDKYILDKFDRSANMYTKSSLAKIEAKIAGNPRNAQAALETLISDLGTDASKLIHASQTEKYVSVNVKQGWIEFRSAGGDWINAGIEEIKSTVLRFAVALSASVDVTSHQQEYMKKLYKFISKYTTSPDLVDFYINHKLGMSETERKTTLQSIKQNRNMQK